MRINKRIKVEGSTEWKLYIAGVPEDKCIDIAKECVELSISTTYVLDDIIQFVSTCYHWEIDYMAAKNILRSGVRLPLNLQKDFLMGTLEVLIKEDNNKKLTAAWKMDGNPNDSHEVQGIDEKDARLL